MFCVLCVCSGACVEICSIYGGMRFGTCLEVQAFAGLSASCSPHMNVSVFILKPSINRSFFFQTDSIWSKLFVVRDPPAAVKVGWPFFPAAVYFQSVSLPVTSSKRSHCLTSWAAAEEMIVVCLTLMKVPSTVWDFSSCTVRE